MAITLRRYSTLGPAPDAPSQLGWKIQHVVDLSSLGPAGDIARIQVAEGQPVEPLAPIIVTDAMRQTARAQMESDALRATGPQRIIAQHALASALTEGGNLDRMIRQWLGEPHPHALHAPWSVTSMHRANFAMTKAIGAWKSPQSSAIIRTAVHGGYQIWTGIGGMMSSAGHAPDIDGAISVAVAASRKKRSEAAAIIRERLAGWSPETPIYSSTLARFADELTLVIRRGPVTGTLHPRPGQLDPDAHGPSSWDLPIWAEIRLDQPHVVTRHEAVVTWDDAASRAHARARQREGERNAKQVTAYALMRIRQSFPDLTPYITARGLAHGTTFIADGKSCFALGPVRMETHHGIGEGRPTMLVELRGTRGVPDGFRIWVMPRQITHVAPTAPAMGG